MSEYIGKKCIVCGKPFTNTDEIVVCPDCGTPYHRECYFKEGKCINTELHEKNQTWKSQNKTNETNDNDTIKCPICGTQNPKTGLFCSKCGLPLNGNKAFGEGYNNNIPPFQTFGNAMPFATVKFNEDADIDGIKAKKFSDYIGNNSFYYLTNFIRFAKTKSKFSLNFIALFFPDLYFFYRKMNLLGISYFILRMIIIFVSCISLSASGVFDGTIISTLFTGIKLSDGTMSVLVAVVQLLSYITSFSAAFFANWLYYRKARKDIEEISSLEISDEQKTELIKRKGGTSFRNLFIAIILPLILTIVAGILIAY